MGRRALGPAPFDEVTVTAVVSTARQFGRLAPGDVWEVVRRLAGRGFSDGQIAYRTGYTVRQTQRIRRGLGIPSPCRGLSGLTRPVQGEPSKIDPWKRGRAADPAPCSSGVA